MLKTRHSFTGVNGVAEYPVSQLHPSEIEAVSNRSCSGADSSVAILTPRSQKRASRGPRSRAGSFTHHVGRTAISTRSCSGADSSVAIHGLEKTPVRNATLGM